MTETIQPLRVTPGWRVDWNQFFDVDPTKEEVEEPLGYFDGAMLTMGHERADRVLDMKWHPELEWEEGSLLLEVYEGDARGELLHEFRTKDRKEMVAEIERLLHDITEGAYWICDPQPGRT